MGPRVAERRRLSDALTSRGFCVLDTHCVADAYRWACEVTLSMIVIDVDTARDRDGFRLTRTLKADHRLRSVPVVILADRNVPGVRKAAHEAGCDGLSTDSSLTTLLPLMTRLLSPSGRYAHAVRRN